MKAVIPAAGLGTRFLPATKAQPKEMLPVFDKPVIQYVVEEAIEAGIDDILIITGRNKRSLEDHFDRYYELEDTLQRSGKDRALKQVRDITNLADVCYVRQKVPKGLGDAILAAQKHIGDEPFAVLLGDTIIKSETPCISQLNKIFEKYQKPTIAIRRIPWKNVERCGIVTADKIGENVYDINKLVEKPLTHQAPTNMAIRGRYILTSDIFDKTRQTEEGIQGEIHLTDALSKMDKVYGVEFTGRCYDMANRFEWLKASIDMALESDSKDELVEFMKTFVG